MEYYIESSQDPDFEENMFIYDELVTLEERSKYFFKIYRWKSKGSLFNPLRLIIVDCKDQSLYDVKMIGSSVEDENSTAQSNTPTSTNSSSPAPSPGLTNHSKSHEEKEEEKKRHKSVEDVSMNVNCWFNFYCIVK